MAKKPMMAPTPVEESEPEALKTVRMRRDAPERENGPTEADVHPLEVANWQAAGWRVAE